jgi:hypothetical protein
MHVDVKPVYYHVFRNDIAELIPWRDATAKKLFPGNILDGIIHQ